MKIVVAGTRGIPGIQGGVETHCQELYPRLAALGHDVTVIRRKPYLTPSSPRGEWRGVKLADLYTPRRKSLEAAVHTFLAVLKARRLNPDVLHIHAIGPSLMTPLARLLGLKVVTTNHGPDYDRAKWGRLARTMLRTGERLGARFSHRVIVISQVIADILATRYGRRDTDLIYNGVNPAERVATTAYIESLGLAPGAPYIVALGRLVKEKGFHDLIEAFGRSGLAARGWSLVICGDSDHPDAYSRQLRSQGAATPGVVFTGFIKGAPLHEVMTHASLFCMPSYHEGLPIALLEAMSYGLDCLVSDIPACRLPQLDAATDLFAVGDTAALASALDAKARAGATPRAYDLTPYDWDRIALLTLDVYRRAAGPSATTQV